MTEIGYFVSFIVAVLAAFAARVTHDLGRERESRLLLALSGFAAAVIFAGIAESSIDGEIRRRWMSLGFFILSVLFTMALMLKGVGTGERRKK